MGESEPETGRPQTRIPATFVPRGLRRGEVLERLAGNVGLSPHNLLFRSIESGLPLVSDASYPRRVCVVRVLVHVESVRRANDVEFT
jgi:hypothetical protein